MITVLPYDQWREAQCEAYLAEHGDDADVQEVECPECHGDGELECDMGHMHECSRCEGEGSINVYELHSWENDPRGFDEAGYFADVVTTIRRYCAFSNRDYLVEVAPFVREWRVPAWARAKEEQAA